MAVCKSKPPRKRRVGPIREPPPPIEIEWRYEPTSPEARERALDALADMVLWLVNEGKDR